VARFAELPAVLVDDAQVHQQVRRQLLVLEVGAPHLDAACRPHVGGQHVQQAGVAERVPGDETLGVVRQRHEARARPLRQVFASATSLSFSIPGTSHSQRSRWRR
jgi:hypothetical protein